MGATDTYLGLRAFFDELARCGLRETCTSPGSRSTPLVLSVAREPRIRATSHLDERSGSFFALGLAKTSGRPVALACTSGTAAANYAPAVTEAFEARVPLLVLTADRPPELRDLGAGQTIDQVKLYGRAAKWYLEVDEAPATGERMRWMRQLACRAFWTSLDGRPGPVHLNFSLREPLVLEDGLPEAEPGGGGRPDGRPWLTRPFVRAEAGPRTVSSLAEDLAARPRAVVVAGRAERDPGLGAAVASFAARMALPLLAEPLSGARRGAAAVAHYDALLRDAGFADAHRPELVLRVGDLPTSKPLRTWLHGLDRSEVVQVAFDPENAWQDPAGAIATIVGADPRATLATVASRLEGVRRDSAWLDAWRRADAAATAAIADTLGAAVVDAADAAEAAPDGPAPAAPIASARAALSEPLVAAELGARLPADATLVVASSMPVRDVETFFPARDDAPRVLSNRGANGIDGTVSTAFGAAAAAHGPVVLLIGDVALAHDIGGLLAASRLGLKVTIVLIDNDGGGIFHFLAVAATEPAADFVEHVATPHGLDFSHAAGLYGLGYERAADLDGFRTALDRALAAAQSTIVSVRTDRDENVALHRRVWEAVARSVRAAN